MKIRLDFVTNSSFIFGRFNGNEFTVEMTEKFKELARCRA